MGETCADGLHQPLLFRKKWLEWWHQFGSGWISSVQMHAASVGAVELVSNEKNHERPLSSAGIISGGCGAVVEL